MMYIGLPVVFYVHRFTSFFVDVGAHFGAKMLPKRTHFEAKLRSGGESATFDFAYTSKAKSLFFRFQGREKHEQIDSGSECKLEAKFYIFFMKICSFRIILGSFWTPF